MKKHLFSHTEQLVLNTGLLRCLGLDPRELLRALLVREVRPLHERRDLGPGLLRERREAALAGRGERVELAAQHVAEVHHRSARVDLLTLLATTLGSILSDHLYQKYLKTRLFRSRNFGRSNRNYRIFKRKSSMLYGIS